MTPEQAAKIVVAGHLGRLTLTIRSIDGDQSVDSTSADAGKGAERSIKASAPVLPSSVFGSDVSSALSDAAPPISPKMRVIQGDAVSETEFH